MLHLANDLVRPKTVINLGDTTYGVDDEGTLYSAYFPQAEYWTLDKHHGGGDYHYREDIMTAKPRRFDLAVCINLLEHLEDPWRAAKRIAKFGKHLFISAPFLYPFHTDKNCNDYWRFTSEGLQLLFPYSVVTADEIDDGAAILFKR